MKRAETRSHGDPPKIAQQVDWRFVCDPYKLDSIEAIWNKDKIENGRKMCCRNKYSIKGARVRETIGPKR